jgi:V/A-type H+/Na+-transporting ATPase subunit I
VSEQKLGEAQPSLIAAAQTLALGQPYVELVGEALRGRGGLSLISGWVPRDDVPRLERALHEQIGPRFHLTVREPAPEERFRVPSMIEYRGWLRPFATLVRSYGVPRYGEIDPTVLFAVSFVLMFGMMFGDLGQGGIIALGGILLWKNLRGFGPFVLSIGLSSMFFGLAYGSVFGIEEWVHPLWMSPMHDPIRMLTLALYWGIGFIVVATMLTVVNRISEGDLRGALLDGRGLGGLAFYAGALFAVWRSLYHDAFGAPEFAALVLPMSVILGYKWDKHRAPPGERILVVLIEGLETVIGYFANTLSFLRVAAFSLNHVALFLAVFAIANTLGTAGHWITVAIGNIFVLVLEGAIVMIQVLRLEYYEGFSRFFSGDGREFRPLRPVSGLRRSKTT